MDEHDEDASGCRLDQFLKLSGLAVTGGQAKLMIQAGDVRVNGQVETRRRHKLSPGDVVEAGTVRLIVPARGSA